MAKNKNIVEEREYPIICPKCGGIDKIQNVKR